MDPTVIDRLQFDAQALMAEHRPAWRHQNKGIVYDVACPSGAIHRGTLTYTRWQRAPLPENANPSAAADRVAPRAGFYDYEAERDFDTAMEWHVNFADPYLFIGHNSPLFAQDEMQVAEHPALGALRDQFRARGKHPLTEEDGDPTPILIAGIERRCRVAIDRDETAGRPRGLYGNEFARAAPEAVRRATLSIDPPTVTNLIAMAAPRGGPGPYSLEEIESVLTTAYVGFRAAVLETLSSRGLESRTIVHTGYWGCGAFGGNRVLMSLLQALAGELSGVHRLVFHSGDDRAALDKALTILKSLRQAPTPMIAIELQAREFEWGTSDGN